MNIEELFEKINTNKYDNNCPLWVKELCLDFGKQLLEGVLENKENITSILDKYLNLEVKDNATYWIEHIEYKGYKYWYTYKQVSEGDICLATREPKNYCNGFYKYLNSTNSLNKAYVVINHDNPNENWFEKLEENDFDVYTKSQVIGFMAQQGLIYNGFDEHLDAWFENYYRQWFQMLDEDKYILHGEG